MVLLAWGGIGFICMALAHKCNSVNALLESKAGLAIPGIMK
jgi:hypothetical protein